MAEPKTVYTDVGAPVTKGSNVRQGVDDILLRLIETKAVATEDRVMRRLDERTSELERHLSRQMAELVTTVQKLKPGATWGQILVIGAGIAASSISIVLGVLAFAGSSFNSGVTSMGAVEEALDVQRELNADQDRRLDLLLKAMEAQNAKPDTRPEAPDGP